MPEDIRPLPEVDESGNQHGFEAEIDNGGEILQMRHGGIDVLPWFDEREILAACRLLPRRILLAYATQTLVDRRKLAVANAIAFAMLALLPGLLLGAVFKHILGFSVFVITLLSAAVWGFVREMSEPGKVWQRSTWLDFDTRMWKARRDFTDHSLPDQMASIPLADLALVCFTHHWEQGVSYEIGLTKLADLKALVDYHDPAVLNVIHSSSDQQRSSEFATELARLWGLPCWQVNWETSVRKRKLA